MAESRDLPFVVDSLCPQGENLNVPEDIKRFREKIALHYQNAFQRIPEFKGYRDMQLNQYIRRYPESVVFIPKKDLHLFPVVVGEAEKFSEKYQTKNSITRPAAVRDHEFEHIQKAGELNVDWQGVGFVMFKKDGKPMFGGFVTGEPDEKLNTPTLLKIWLAPKKPSAGDWFEALKIILGNDHLSEIVQNISNEEVLLILSDKLFPGPIKKLLRRLMGGQNYPIS